MFKNMKIGMRLGLSFGLILAMLAAVGTYAILHIAELSASIELVVKDRMVKTRQATVLIDNANLAARSIRNMLLLEDPAKIAEEKARVENTTVENTKIYDSLEASIKSPEGIKLMNNAQEARKSYGAARSQIMEQLAQGKKPEATIILFSSLRDAQANYMKAINDLIDLQQNIATKDGEEAAQAAAALERILILVIAGLIVASSVIAWLLTRSLTGPIGQCIEISEKVARGETNLDIQVNSADETGTLMNAMKLMVDTLNRLLADMKKMSDEHDKGDIDVQVPADKYEGAFKLMAEGVNGMTNGHISVQKKAMACVGEFGRGNMDAPLEKFPGKKAFINETIEQVRVNIKALVVDANMLAQAAVDGKLAIRADASKHLGDFRKIVQGVNDTLDSVIGPLNVAAKYVDDISKGNIPAKITDSYNGDFNQLKNNLNTCIEAVNALVKDADMLVQAALEGRLSTRADASRHQGDFRKVVQGVNDTLDAVIGPVNEAAAALEKVAARDLTARMQGNYKGDLAKIKNALNTAVDNLEQALGQVSESTAQVASASGQISSGSQNLAQGANEQASSLEEVSASLEEMSSMTRQNADNAMQAKNLSGEADQNAAVGTEAMSRMSNSIQKIKESSDQTAKIVKTIDEIAMQTNLLALNAAVEAARAGEAGRGFAVVAEEVRNLAQRSAQAAKNTADMIGESVRNADDGVKIATEVSTSFDRIAGSSKKVNDLIAEIAAASKEQAAGIKQVNDAVSQMDKVTQQNAANAEESASASEELSSQAAELQAMVAQFNIGKAVSRAPAIATKHTKALPGLRSSDPARKPRIVSAEEVIPMDEDILKDF